MEKTVIENLAADVINSFFNDSEKTYDDPDAVFTIGRRDLMRLKHQIYSVMLEIHGDGVREGVKQVRERIGELVDLPARVAELERKEEYRAQSDLGD